MKCSTCVQKAFDDAEAIIEFIWDDAAEAHADAGNSFYSFCPLHPENTDPDHECHEFKLQFKQLVIELVANAEPALTGYYTHIGLNRTPLILPLCFDHIFESETES